MWLSAAENFLQTDLRQIQTGFENHGLGHRDAELLLDPALLCVDGPSQESRARNVIVLL
jgi:hypothetical protein